MFTPLQTLLGGYLLHLSTSSLLSLAGRVFGVSGIVSGAVLGDRASWRWATLGGMFLGPLLVSMTGLNGSFPDDGLLSWGKQGWARLMLGGSLVGLGSRLGSGCTSGHFLCGVSRLSPRSLIATLTFFSTSLLTSYFFPSPFLSPPTSSLHLIPSASFTPSSSSILILLTTVGLTILLQTLPTFLPLTKLHLRSLPYILNGIIFSLGLQMSGMISPLKVAAFLTPFSPDFDPSLALIVITGVIPNAIQWGIIKNIRRPKLDWESWNVPTRPDIDWKLLLGSSLFGVGWALTGVCPGPAVVGLSNIIFGTLSSSTYQDNLMILGKVGTYMGCMLAGMAIVKV
ncbi:hypothetical protein M231_06225 [Tremella mesenterica]|uniref:Sulphur transport domain-containing protein n=1 Tax=Tremella mesenterica TaxID=5217 RepID=A0A4Q1BEH5_TREME|nr:hypothetical protein M231_06225 [Tremella mesenterica]